MDYVVAGRMSQETPPPTHCVHACAARLPGAQVPGTEIPQRGRQVGRGRGTEPVGDAGQDLVSKQTVSYCSLTFLSFFSLAL